MALKSCFNLSCYLRYNNDPTLSIYFKYCCLLHVACCKIDFEKSLQEGEMYNYKSYIYYIYYNIYNIYKIICN